jgi:hypothetical protein
MKQRAIKQVISFCLVATGLVASVILLRGHSPLFNLLFPPSGMYVPMASAPLSTQNRTYEFEVIHKYPGSYDLAIEAPSSPGLGSPYQMDFQATVSIHLGDEKILEKNITEPSSMFWRNESGGIVLLSYSVPELLPRNDPARIALQTKGNVANFSSRYGTSTLVVRKGSDK